jgi:hypothetical protein
MNKQNLFSQIAIGVAALALGAAFASAPAFAEYYGRNVNDGGMPPEPAVTATPATKSSTKGVTPVQPTYYGRNVDDGGMPPEPTAAAKAAAAKSPATAQKQAAPAPLGRNVDDGGLTTITAQ